MARDTITVTQSWQLIATGIVAITVKTDKRGNLSFNETASDADALTFSVLPNNQFIQTEAKPTATGTN